jgi:membrane fusion protein, copper/silver efflux system
MTLSRVARWPRLARIMAMAVLPVLAIVVAAFATGRERVQVVPSEQGGQSGHQHAQPVGTDRPQPVALSKESAHRIGVTYAVVTEDAVAREVRVVGQIAFDETRVKVIAPKVDGWIERLYADAAGQAIEAGAPVMAVYSPMVATAQEELLLAKRLVTDIAGADSAARAHASSMLAAARSRLAAWDVSGDDVARLERTGRVERTVMLRSPSAGFVMEKNVVQGQRIMAGDVLYRIVDLSSVWLEGEVYEQDLAAVHLGQRVSAEVGAIPGSTFAGRIAYLSPTLNPETRTARLRVELPNPGYRLKPGMVATLRLVGRAQARMLTVPRAAVLSTGERHLVFVKRSDGMLEPRLVTIAAASDERIAILSGLTHGDSVVASATFLVDAESSLGTALGGMGSMPGMDIVAPRKKD